MIDRLGNSYKEVFNVKNILIAAIAVLIISINVLAAQQGKLRVIVPTDGCRIYLDDHKVYEMDKRHMLLRLQPGYHSVVIKDGKGVEIYRGSVDVGVKKVAGIKVPRKK